MSFLRAARAALAGKSGVPRTLAVAVVPIVLAGLSLSCGSSHHSTGGPNHNAYITLPSRGSVLLLHINGSTGAITTGAETPQVQNTSPNGIALMPSKKFLYAVNSANNSISIFNVASDGTLTLTGTPTPVSFGPINAVVDPSGKVKWAYVSDSAADRPSPVALAKAAVAVASGKEPPNDYPGKL